MKYLSRTVEAKLNEGKEYYARNKKFQVPEFLDPNMGDEYFRADTWLRRIAELYNLPMPEGMEELMEKDLSDVCQFRFGYLLGILLSTEQDAKDEETIRNYTKDGVYSEEVADVVRRVVTSWNSQKYINPRIARAILDDLDVRFRLGDFLYSKIFPSIKVPNNKLADGMDVNNRCVGMEKRCGYQLESALVDGNRVYYFKAPSNAYRDTKVASEWLRYIYFEYIEGEKAPVLEFCHRTYDGIVDTSLRDRAYGEKSHALHVMECGALCDKLGGYQFDNHRIDSSKDYERSNSLYIPWEVHAAIPKKCDSTALMKDWGWLA